MIMLIDIDSTIPNLALAKIAEYHKGEELMWNNPLFADKAEKVYVSCIFDWNRDKCNEWHGAYIGGSGYSLDIKLPAEIEVMKPKINYGFTTRGCIRNCYFCIVPKKEGGIKAVGDIYDIWDGKSKEIILMDNNILAMPDHFKLICSQIRKEKIKVDFNQGLDHRLLTDDICQELLTIRHKREIRFAYDDLAYKKSVLKAIDMLRKAGLKDWQSRWYVYVGEKDTFETVYERLELLRENKQKAYVMRDKKIADKPVFIGLARWANLMGMFRFPLSEAVNNSEMAAYKRYLTEYEQ